MVQTEVEVLACVHMEFRNFCFVVMVNAQVFTGSRVLAMPHWVLIILKLVLRFDPREPHFITKLINSDLFLYGDCSEVGFLLGLSVGGVYHHKIDMFSG